MRTCFYTRIILIVATLLVVIPAFGFDFIPTPLRIDVGWTTLTSPGEEVSNTRGLTMFIFSPDNVLGDYALIGHNYSTASAGGYRCNILVLNDLNQTVTQLNFPWCVNGVAGRDINGDGRNELVTAYSGETLAGVRIYDPDLNGIICEFTMQEKDYRWRGTPKWAMNIIIGPTVNGVLEGRPALLLYPAAGFGRMPKGLVLIDPLNGKEIWHYWIGGSVDGDHVVVADSIDGGCPRIIFGTYAAGNGAVWNATDDTLHSYLVAVDLRGKLLWMKSFTGIFAGIKDVFPLKHGRAGLKEVLAFYRAAGTGSERSRLIRVDARDGTIIKETAVEDGWIWPWERISGRNQFLLTTLGKGIFVYDEDLKLIQEVKRDQTVRLVADIDGDGKSEIVCPEGTDQVKLLSHEFRLLARYKFAAGIMANGWIQRIRKSKNSSVWLTNKDGIAQFLISRTPHYAWQIVWRLLLFSLGPGIAVYGSVRALRWRLAAIKAKEDRQRMEAWSTMASGLAHDVRTPLAVLRLSGENLELELKNAYGPLPESLHRYFETIQKETDRTETVAQRLLTLTRQAPPVLEELDLSALVKETVERCPHSSNVEVRLEIEKDLPLAYADYQQMTSLLENLISNGLKAMKDRGCLTIRLHTAQELRKRDAPRDVFVLEVTDTGRGIPPKDLPRIFEPYFSHNQGGTGLGLALVKRTVEDHHGSIEVQSSVGVGTRICIHLPCNKET